jgi:hypothetical protein
MVAAAARLPASILAGRIGIHQARAVHGCVSWARARAAMSRLGGAGHLGRVDWARERLSGSSADPVRCERPVREPMRPR